MPAKSSYVALANPRTASRVLSPTSSAKRLLSQIVGLAGGASPSNNKGKASRSIVSAQ